MLHEQTGRIEVMIHSARVRTSAQRRASWFSLGKGGRSLPALSVDGYIERWKQGLSHSGRLGIRPGNESAKRSGSGGRGVSGAKTRPSPPW